MLLSQSQISAQASVIQKIIWTKWKEYLSTNFGSYNIQVDVSLYCYWGKNYDGCGVWLFCCTWSYLHHIFGISDRIFLKWKTRVPRVHCLQAQNFTECQKGCIRLLGRHELKEVRFVTAEREREAYMCVCVILDCFMFSYL
jgi:hypothetical protein